MISNLTKILGGSLNLDYRIHLLKSHNIIKGVVAKNKTSLLSANEEWQNLLKTISQNLGNNFITDIAQRNRPIIRNELGVAFFRN